MTESAGVLSFAATVRPRRRALISLTPLVDMVFILLVFFMLASSYLDWRAITVSAGMSDGGTSGDKGALLIHVTPDGLRYAGRPASTGEIFQAVQSRLAANPNQRVVVEPRGGVVLQDVVSVLDRLSALGVTAITLSGVGDKR